MNWWMRAGKFATLALKGGKTMFNISLDLIEDKVEFFEADDLQTLEKKLTSKSNIIKHCCFPFTMCRTKCMSWKTGNGFTVRLSTSKQKNNRCPCCFGHLLDTTSKCISNVSIPTLAGSILSKGVTAFSSVFALLSASSLHSSPIQYTLCNERFDPSWKL